MGKDVAASPAQDDLEFFLAHYGVKGMKWGVRKDRGHEGERASKRTIDKADRKYDEEHAGFSGYVKINNLIADTFNSNVGVLNDKYADIDIDVAPPSVQKEYYREVEQLFDRSIAVANQRLGTNASGTKRVRANRVGAGINSGFEVIYEELKHSEEPTRFRFLPKFNDKGFVVGFSIAPEEDMAEHTDLSDFLTHYGVKGMRWGVRRDLKGIRGASNRTEYLQKKDAAWINKVNANPKLEKISRMVAKDAKAAIKDLNRAYPKKFGMRSKADQARYDRALEETLAASIDRAAYKTHKLSPTRAHEVKITRTDSGELLAKVTRRTNPKIIKTEAKLNRMDERAKKAVAHAEEELTVDDFEGLGFLLVEDEDRMVVDILTPFDDVSHAEQLDDFLAHYGVKGMKWGVIRGELGKLKTENERHDYLQKLESDRMAKFEDPKFRREILDEAAPGIAKAMVGLEKRYPKENKFWASMGAGAGKHKSKDESWEEYFRSNPKALSDADEAYGRFSFLAQAAKIHTDEYAKVIERKIGKVSETGVYETIPVITSGDPDLRVTFVTRYNTEPRMRKQLTEAIRHAKNKSIVIAEDVYLITSEGLELTHSNNDLSDFLAHYGVKGMRWGVRKDRSSSSGGRQQKKSTGDKEDDNAKSKATKSKNELSRYSDDKLTSMTAELKGLDALSDAELKKLTGRMQLEQTYRDLQAKQPKTKSKAEKFLDGAKLLGTTANQLNEFLNTPAGKALQSKLKSKVKK